jgi:hypothetical protein
MNAMCFKGWIRASVGLLALAGAGAFLLFPMQSRHQITHLAFQHLVTCASRSQHSLVSAFIGGGMPNPHGSILTASALSTAGSLRLQLSSGLP